jgi:putative Mn2+ efflux pump MntP
MLSNTSEFLNILLIGVGLSADACAVALSSGLAIKHSLPNKAFKIALFFGGFQGIMPIIGWCLGIAFQDLIHSIDHWVAFGLLSFIGGKMFYEAISEQDEDEKAFNPTDNKTLLTLAIATSIDALAVGLSFAVLQTDILSSSVLIAITTFILSFIFVFIGHRLGDFFKAQVDIFGGLILIGIGIKIVLEHTKILG